MLRSESAESCVLRIAAKWAYRLKSTMNREPAAGRKGNGAGPTRITQFDTKRRAYFKLAGAAEGLTCANSMTGRLFELADHVVDKVSDHE